MARDRDSELPRGKKRVKRRHALGLFAFVALLLVIMFLPRILTSKSLLTGIVNQYAGIAPLRVDFERVDAGWLTPVSATGIRLSDAEGNRLVQVADVQTEKGILGWIMSSSSLGTIKVNQVEAAVVAYDGTTNIEQALQPLLESLATTPEDASTDTSSSASMSGTIEVTDSRFLLTERGRPEQWVVSIPQLSVALPNADQVVGPVELKMNLADASGTVPDSMGKIAADVHQSPTDGAFEVRAMMENVPIDFWHVLHARLPEVPIEELQGRVSAVLAGKMVSDQAWSFAAQKLEASNLAVVAPTLLGEQPARLTQIAGRATCTLSDNLLQLVGAELNCDFATTAASASIPWPIEIPTAENPFLNGATVDASGVVDLPRLVQAAKSLIPIRDDTQLTSGRAQFAFKQNKNADGTPYSNAKLQLSDLKAMASGQALNWQTPLAVELNASKNGGALRLDALAQAEFASLQGGGSIESGQLVGNVDLNVLQQRLSQWVELPITTMNGAANIDMHWTLQGSDVVVASGTLETSPLVIATSIGKELKEPAWKGNLDAQLTLANGSPQRIDQAKLALTSRDERVSLNLQQPLYLVEPEGTTPAPAAFDVDLQLNLANCNRRGTVWLTEPPEVDVRGNLQLVANGLIDLHHVELLSANWGSKPIEVHTPTVSFAEPQMVGKFTGRVDTNDLTRLVVEVLQVQSTSFSLGAQDSANPDGSESRIGRAVLHVDLDRLMRNVNNSVANAQALPPGTEAASKLSATGIMDLQLAWQVNATAAGVNTQVTGQNIVVYSQSPGQIAPQPIWQEPNLTATVAGTWIADNNQVDIPTLQLQLPWLNYAGSVAYSQTQTGQAVKLNGNANYDSAQLSTKLAPFTGGQVQLVGTQNVPINVSWNGNADPNASVLSGLQVATQLGWEQALVAGIALGKADVPIRITDGQLATAAEIPVSGGALRWDIESDLAAPELVLVQKPMNVLENVEITEEMCQGWLKYVAPLLAEATSVDGRLSLRLDEAKLTPADPKRQTVLGQIVIHNATVGPGPLSNQVITLVKQVEAIRKKDFTQAVSSTQRVWMDMPEQRIDFEMRDGRVVHRNLNVKIGDARISTSGSVAVDGQMEMLATMPIPDDWADKSPLLAGLKGQSLQFPMGGTLSQPQIDTRLLQQLGRQTVQNAASGLLQQQLNRGLDKLLGGQAGQATPAAPNATGQNPPPANPIQGLGEQILGGQGINLPGLFPGFGGQKPPAGGK